MLDSGNIPHCGPEDDPEAQPFYHFYYHNVEPDVGSRLCSVGFTIYLFPLVLHLLKLFKNQITSQDAGHRSHIEVIQSRASVMHLLQVANKALIELLNKS